MAAIYTMLVMVIRGGKGGHDPFPVFVLCGLATWKFFANCVMESFNSVDANSDILKSYAFPRAVLPITATLTQALIFMGPLTLVAFAGFIMIDDLGWQQFIHVVIYLPILFVMLATFAMGFALFFSTVGVLIADAKKFIRHFMRLGFYGSPGLYAISDVISGYEGAASIGELSLRHLYLLNPMAHFIYCFRCLFFYGRVPDNYTLGILALLAVIAFLVGLAVFRRVEAKLPKLV